MAQTQMSKQELSQLASQYAASLMREGRSNEELVEALLDEGLSIQDAEFIVQYLLKIRAENIRRESQILMGKGFAIILASLVLSVFVNVFFNGMAHFVVIAGLVFGVLKIKDSLLLKRQAHQVQKSFLSH